jgi:hypothetical protein
LGSPWWLLGLALLPLIRWLHRGGRHRRRLTVPHLALWRGLPAQPASVGARTPPDPAWRRRAALATLLLLALAQPQWPRSGLAVTLWVDDSLSMLTREAGGSRLALGLAQARAQLAEAGATEVQLRTLGDPWRVLPVDDAALQRVVADASRREPAAPPAALLRPDRQHWLLTDGAKAELQSWPAARRADRVVQVGTVDRNAGVQRLSARRRPDDPQRLDLRVGLRNGGAQPEVRELLIDAPPAAPQRRRVELAPGALVELGFIVPWTNLLQATLQPADALVQDDGMALDLAPLAPVPLAVDGRCAVGLRAALQVHPALRAQDEAAADASAQVRCGGPAASSPLPTLAVQADRLAVRAQGPWAWGGALPGAARIEPPEGGLPLSARLAVAPGDQVLLAAGDQPVLVRRDGSPVQLITALDFDALAAERSPALPQLANLMLEQLLQRPLLGELVRHERGARASRVRPGDAPAAPAQAPRAMSPLPGEPLARPLLLLAGLVLLWELAALWRQMRRLGDAA